MSLYLSAKTYRCEYMDFEVNEVGKVVVTLAGDFPETDQMATEEVLSIVNDPLFYEVLCMAYENASPGTPLRGAFERMNELGGTVELRFQQSDAEEAVA